MGAAPIMNAPTVQMICPPLLHAFAVVYEALMSIIGTALIPFVIVTVRGRTITVPVGAFSICLEDDEYFQLAGSNFFNELRSSGYLGDFTTGECAGGGGGGVDQLVAGTNVTLSPPTGLGTVTINASVPAAPSSLLQNVVHVAKNGNDTGATGSIAKPFLTVQAAMEYAWTTYVLPVEPQPSSPFTRPCVFVNAGTYVEAALVLPPQICVMGQGYNHSRIVGNWTIDARWSNAINASDFRSFWINIGLFGDVLIDFDATASNEGKIYGTNVRFGGSANVNIIQKTANPSSNQGIFTACEFLGSLTVAGMPIIVQACYTAALILNQAVGGGVDNLFTSSGGTIGDVTINATSGAAPVYNCSFGHNVRDGGTLTLNGTFSSIKADLSSLPLQSLITLAGGALLTQITQTNQPNFSGTTAQRPLVPYVGQQYFDTALGAAGLPIWWNGAAWMDAAGVLV